MPDVDAIWAQVPSVQCKGLCVESCGPVVPSDGEAAVLERRGVVLDFDRETLTCNQLKLGRCQVYNDRPLLCRLWGAVPKMRCPFDCEPTLTDEQGNALMRALYQFVPEGSADG